MSKKKKKIMYIWELVFSRASCCQVPDHERLCARLKFLDFILKQQGF